MSYEETWAKAAEADSQIAKHFDHWLTLARGLSGMREHLRAKSGANSDASPLYRRAYAEWVPTRPWAAKWAGPGKSSFRSRLLLAGREPGRGRDMARLARAAGPGPLAIARGCHA